MKFVQIAVAALISLSFNACDTCDSEEACEVSDFPLRTLGLTQGVAGVAYSSSDVVSNGCRDCQFESYPFILWQFDTDPTNPDVISETLDADDPDQSLTAIEQYALELESAHYLICTDTMPKSCAVFELQDGEIWTVHLRGGYAVPSPNLKVIRPDETLDEDLPFLYPAEP